MHRLRCIGVTSASRMVRKALPDIGVLTLLLLLPLLLLAPVALGSKTLLPVDYLFLFEPYRADAADLGVIYPHNHLVAEQLLPRLGSHYTEG